MIFFVLVFIAHDLLMLRVHLRMCRDEKEGEMGLGTGLSVVR
jgi:hypothetical protein